MSMLEKIRDPKRVPDTAAARSRRKRRVSPREFLAHHAATLLLIAAAVLMIFPILWMISLSFQPASEIYKPQPSLIPINPTFDNFVEGWTTGGFVQYYINSSVVTTVRVVLTVAINALAGFAFAKYSFRGKGFLFVLILSAMMIPDQVRMVPLYSMFNQLDLLNSYWSVILPGVGATFGTFLMTQYARSIPDELLEAARIDGSSEWRIFRQVVIPLVTPALVTNVIFQFIWGWNDLLYPLLFLQDDEKYTLPLALASLGGSNALGIGPIMAMSLLTIIPVLIVFFALQKFFIQGIASQGLKG